MKRIFESLLTLGLMAALTLGVVGCGGGEEEEGISPAETAAPEPTGEPGGMEPAESGAEAEAEGDVAAPPVEVTEPTEGSAPEAEPTPEPKAEGEGGEG